jgi:hypothetical protein
MPTRAVLLCLDWTILRMYPPLRHAWSWRGQQKLVRITGENARRVLFGAINLRTGHRVLLRRKRATQADFQAFLRELHRRYPGRVLWLLLDRAGCQTAPNSQRLAEQLKMVRVWLPKQTPKLNAMDHLWREGKRNVSANRQYRSIDGHARRFECWIMHLTNWTARRKAGILSEHFWLKRLL